MNGRLKNTQMGALATAAIALAFLTLGCGSHEEHTASAAAGGTDAVTAAQSGPAIEPLPPGSASEVAPPSQGQVVASADSIPPEIDASVADTLVTKGSVVEITADASPDVTSMSLRDGTGTEQLFAYDSDRKLWHVFYRVPMKIRADRCGLSITASNGSNHWRRVWLFLRVEQEEKAGEP
jgi:hypothetical protein